MHQITPENVWRHMWRFYRITSIYLCVVLTVIAVLLIFDVYRQVEGNDAPGNGSGHTKGN